MVVFSQRQSVTAVASGERNVSLYSSHWETDCVWGRS